MSNDKWCPQWFSIGGWIWGSAILLRNGVQYTVQVCIKSATLNWIMIILCVRIYVSYMQEYVHYILFQGKLWIFIGSPSGRYGYNLILCFPENCEIYWIYLHAYLCLWRSPDVFVNFILTSDHMILHNRNASLSLHVQRCLIQSCDGFISPGAKKILWVM